jgi:hypothetical protein
MDIGQLQDAINFTNYQQQTQGPTMAGIGYNEAANVPILGNAATNILGNWQQLYGPLQQKFVSDVSNYDTPGSEEMAAGQASADVGAQYQAAGDAARRQLEGYGINPSSTRFAGLDIGMRTGQAAAEAAAANQARINRQTTGMGLEATALNIGNQAPSQAAQLAGSAVGTGAGAISALGAPYTTYAPGYGSPTQWAALGQNAVGQQTGFMQNQFQDMSSSFNQNQNSSSGLGSLFGAGLGFLGTAGSAGPGSFFSSLLSAAPAAAVAAAKGGKVPSITGGVPGGNASDFPSPAARGAMPTPSRPMGLPRNLHRLSNVPLTMRFDDGGDVPPVPQSAVPAGVPMAGQQVPPAMSPSGGAATDDIPATVGQSPGGPATGMARINADEFIMPKDVANWMGEKQLQNMVMKARQEMQQHRPAQVTMGHAGGGGAGIGAAAGAPRGGIRPVGPVRPGMPMHSGPRGAVPIGHPGMGMGMGMGAPRPMPISQRSMMMHAPPRPHIPRHAQGGAVAIPRGFGGGAGPGIGISKAGVHNHAQAPLTGSNASRIRSPITGV